jgi:outer membrane receptor for Fe3+-dicitrate
LNINIDDNNNVFFNAGYYSRQPNFGAVYINFGNNLNPDVKNEQVFAQEVGYGFRNDKLSVHFNAYNTSWKNRWITKQFSINNYHDGTASFKGVEEIHTGVELELKYRPAEIFTLNGMVSVGNWRYKNNVDADIFDRDRNLLDQTTLHLDNVKVGDAAQFTSSLGFTLKASKTFKWDANWRHAGNLYAALDATDFTAAGKQALELPSYNLINTGFTYGFNTKHQKVFNRVTMRLNINNLVNTHYIAESATSKAATSSTTNWRGVNVDNRVYWGYGRTYNFTLRFKF